MFEQMKKNRKNKRKTIRDGKIVNHIGREITMEDMEYLAYQRGVGRDIDEPILSFDKWKLNKDGIERTH